MSFKKDKLLSCFTSLQEIHDIINRNNGYLNLDTAIHYLEIMEKVNYENLKILISQEKNQLISDISDYGNWRSAHCNANYDAYLYAKNASENQLKKYENIISTINKLEVIFSNFLENFSIEKSKDLPSIKETLIAARKITI